MNNLFIAIRHLANPGRSTESARNSEIQTYSAPLREALLAYERHNRGHSRLLAQGALNASAKPPFGSVLYVAQDTLKSSLLALLRTLAAHAKDQLPQTEAFQALLGLPDDCGHLVPLTKRALEADMFWAMQPSQSPISLARCDMLPGTIGKLVLQATFSGQRGTWRSTATRRITLGDNPTNLAEARQLLINAKRELKALLADSKSWPEFSESTHTDTLRRQAREKIEQMLRGYAAEERAYLLDNWSNLRPAF